MECCIFRKNAGKIPKLRQKRLKEIGKQCKTTLFLALLQKDSLLKKTNTKGLQAKTKCLAKGYGVGL